jgi:hypothetical protein
MADESARFKLISSSQIAVVDVGATANRPYISDEWLLSLYDLVRCLPSQCFSKRAIKDVRGSAIHLV